MPVNFGHLRNPKRDMVWVALAGPASNFIQAIVWAVVMITLVGTGVEERFFLEMARAGVLVNLVMWAFNLFPVPPLDGGRILVGLLPWRQAQMVSRLEPYGFFIVMGLVAPPGQLCGLHPPLGGGQPAPGCAELLLSGRLPRAHQV